MTVVSAKPDRNESDEDLINTWYNPPSNAVAVTVLSAQRQRCSSTVPSKHDCFTTRATVRWHKPPTVKWHHQLELQGKEILLKVAKLSQVVETVLRPYYLRMRLHRYRRREWGRTPRLKA